MSAESRHLTLVDIFSGRTLGPEVIPPQTYDYDALNTLALPQPTQPPAVPQDKDHSEVKQNDEHKPAEGLNGDSVPQSQAQDGMVKATWYVYLSSCFSDCNRSRPILEINC